MRASDSDAALCITAVGETSCFFPVDVVECLKSVSSPDGYLTFDQFVRGLKLSLNKRDPVKAYDPPPKPLKPAALQARAFNLPYQACICSDF